MPPTTQPQNKTKHPGLPDLPVIAQEATLSPGSRSGAKLQLKAKSKTECNAITKQVIALEADLLMQQQQARTMACQPPGPSQGKQPQAKSTMYRTRSSSGQEATGKGDQHSTRKWQPTSDEESEVVDKRKTWPRKKQKGSTGEEIPATTQTRKATDVQKMSKTVVGKSSGATKMDHSYTGAAGSGRATRSTIGSQVTIGSNMTEWTDAHTRSNPTGATTDNDTTGVDNDLNQENWGEIVSRRQPEATQLKSNATRVLDVSVMGREVDKDTMRLVVDEEENAESTSNPDGMLQARYKSSYGRLSDGDDANDAHTQVLHISSMLLSPCPSPFHLTPNSEPTSPLLHLKKPRPSRHDSVPVNMPVQTQWLKELSMRTSVNIRLLQIGDPGQDCDGHRVNNAQSDQEECSNNNNNHDNNHDDSSLPPVISHYVEQSRLNVRAFKKGPGHPLKAPRVGQPSQRVQKSGPLQNQASSALGCMQGLSHHAVEADEENFESELSEPCCKPQQKANKFRNEDLPGLPYTMAPFHDIIIPWWIFYFSSLNSPWKLANPLHITYVQKVWNETFLNIKCMVALRNEPIFALICSPVFLLSKFVLILLEVKQQTYDWHSELATHALKAVEAFFDWYEEVDTTDA
ncbi:hypothetical protein BKA83DRAFT_4495801 [Pisolithus microcarpus]|nr:hypothetical protein BKA83DRAFT_4495801 [Pisolithus microcarpus]